jgi:Fic family protein
VNRKTGENVTTSTIDAPVKAFVPFAWPPNPPLEISAELQEKLDNALLSLGRLDSITTLLPDPTLFLHMYIRKEAVLSSIIEGTQSSLSDLLLFEMEEVPGVPINDVKEVSNYVSALNYGIKRLREGFPLCNRLLREIHGILLESGRGCAQCPGEFRRSQNWIGGTRPGNARYVPPPVNKVAQCMTDLEKFYNDIGGHTSVLIKAALAHVQFETIHPFLDGNGRLGRMLITLILYAEKVLQEPLLYLSLYFKTHRSEYYGLLQRVRIEGNWESWVDFFAEAVEFTALQATRTASSLVKLSKKDQESIGHLKRVAGTVLRVHGALIEKPLLTIPKACEMTKLHPATVTSAFESLQKLGIVREITGKRRNRTYAYEQYIALLNEGTEPLDT